MKNESSEAGASAGLPSGKDMKDIADAASTTVDTVARAAKFVDSLFGNSISNSIGLISDKLAYYRLEKAIELQERVEKKLAARGAKKRYVPVAFGLPIIEKATVEEDETLQEKWANLLANARDASYDKPLRRNFTSILADLEAVDARILDLLVPAFLNWTDAQRESGILFVLEKISKNYSLPLNVCENSIRNLMRLGLVKPGNVQGGAMIGDHPISSYKDTEMFSITQMGVDFYRAVNEGK